VRVKRTSGKKVKMMMLVRVWGTFRKKVEMMVKTQGINIETDGSPLYALISTTRQRPLPKR
jgi:hypothetical protein